MKAIIWVLALTGGVWLLSGPIPVAAGEPKGLGGQLYATGGDVTVTIQPYNPNVVYVDEVWLSSPFEAYIGLGSPDVRFAPPKPAEVGKQMTFRGIPAGTELIFKLEVVWTPEGNRFTWYTGPGTRNGDGFAHAIVTDLGNGEALVGFEDLPYITDREFADAVFLVKGVRVSVPKIVHDPGKKFVTGGGWIDSPPEAYYPDTPTQPKVTGRLSFGFNAKYLPGRLTPDGEIEVQFRQANLNFHSIEHTWLVVVGAKAEFQGRGTINGHGIYGFQVTVYDGKLLGGGQGDRFRIRIWDDDPGSSNRGLVIYDNYKRGASGPEAIQPIASGSIVIHK